MDLLGASCCVFLQIAPVVECSVTFFAGVSLYSRVGSCLQRQRVFMVEPPVASPAGIRRLFSGVSYGMLLQIAPVVECGVTFFAGIPCHVHPFMRLQTLIVAECLVTL